MMTDTDSGEASLDHYPEFNMERCNSQRSYIYVPPEPGALDDETSDSEDEEDFEESQNLHR